MTPTVRRIRRLRTDRFTVDTVEFGAGFLLAEHSHPWSCFQVVLRGRFVERGTGPTDPVGPGTLIYRPAGCFHENPVLPGASISLCVQLDERVFRDVLPAAGEVAGPQALRSPEIHALAARVGAELARPDDLTPSVVEAACVQLLGLVVRGARGAASPLDSRLVRRAEALIERDRGRLRVEALARELEVSRHQLNRAFARTLGSSVGVSLRGRRLAEARRLLDETRLPIAEVALRTGFADQSHLTRHFQAAYGFTPGQARGGSEWDPMNRARSEARATIPRRAPVQDRSGLARHG